MRPDNSFEFVDTINQKFQSRVQFANTFFIISTNYLGFGIQLNLVEDFCPFSSTSYLSLIQNI